MAGAGDPIHFADCVAQVARGRAARRRGVPAGELRERRCRDSPAASAHLLDTDGRRYAAADTATTAGRPFAPAVTLEPGGSATGFVAFRLPEDAGPAAVRFALNSGRADDVGHWSLS
ncbi:hypothetical protein ACIO7M_30520 [Streptomyces toxytricini]|uniref:DUF4352 domain-containing protein n=1 Tax=Streptomyces toxytricini TaxID=67369 RepID=A0ABW8EQ69_STRT5